MIQMTTDGKIDLLKPKCNKIGKRIECDLNNLILQAFDIGYKEGYKTGKGCNECIHPYADLEQCTECHNESEPLTFDNVKVGDELRSIPSKPMYESTVIVVTHNCADRIYGFRKNTGAYMQLGQSDLSGWRKTGKTYPEIAKLIGGRE